MDLNFLTERLSELPLFHYFFADPQKLEFTERVRYVCSTNCPMYNKTWACPPAVGAVAECKTRCLQYKNCLVIGTIVEVADIASIEDTLATRGDHEEVTNQVADLFRQQGVTPYVLSTEACAICDRCAWLDGEPCRHPEHMHPCVESHGINVIPLLEENGIDFQYGGNIVTWFSLLFFNE